MLPSLVRRSPSLCKRTQNAWLRDSCRPNASLLKAHFPYQRGLISSLQTILPSPAEEFVLPQTRPNFQGLFAASNGEHQNVWKSLWDNEAYDYWDRGETSPSLIDFLKDHPELVQQTSSEPLKVLVPGCGRGHDVHLFASYGIRAYGLELTETAIDIARNFAESQPPPPPPGSRTFLAGDFFSNAWLKSLETKQFDLMYDYTFMVALDPAEGYREKWAERVASLIKPGGVLICLEFPLYKSHDAPGPPWAIRSDDYATLLEPVGFERIHHVKPARYLAAGKDSDMIGAWRRK